MSCQPRVLDITTGRQVKRSQANGWIEQCAYRWKEYGVSIEKLTLAEMREARSEQGARHAPIASAEIPGIKVTGIPQDFSLIREANQFAAQAF